MLELSNVETPQKSPNLVSEAKKDNSIFGMPPLLAAGIFFYGMFVKAARNANEERHEQIHPMPPHIPLAEARKDEEKSSQPSRKLHRNERQGIMEILNQFKSNARETLTMLGLGTKNATPLPPTLHPLFTNAVPIPLRA